MKTWYRKLGRLACLTSDGGLLIMHDWIYHIFKGNYLIVTRCCSQHNTCVMCTG